MDEDEIEEKLNRKKAELKSELKEELGAGDTRIDASLGMFSLTVDSEEDLESTVEAFQTVWTDRIEELEDSRADTMREKLEDEDVGFILG
ncbi:hypothetical protein [Halolamina salifodinae]|uniref:S-methylmethionine-dependent homocysteine/selenocysteine methylase n=1 Tax=Halolamina salifodinae TaxID=1202767 RepID=A0A8T4GV29_9EURY|nr:hypothetical protein [Halolamina salifodinae]MBP1986756.1 S-methylmethionine-dependent homocysteine/selenocysteine methylase [Halolamina salifodinae]